MTVDAELLHRFAGRAMGLLPPDLRAELQVLAAQAWAVLRAQHAPICWELVAPGVHVIDGRRLQCPYPALDAAHAAVAAGSCSVAPFARLGARHADQVVRRSLRRECASWAQAHASRLVPVLAGLAVRSGRVVYAPRAGGPQVQALGLFLVRGAAP
jgi:hypothetical protein